MDPMTFKAYASSSNLGPSVLLPFEETFYFSLLKMSRFQGEHYTQMVLDRNFIGSQAPGSHGQLNCKNVISASI